MTSAGKAGSQSLNWAAYAAVVWSILFAGMSFYWAAGGTVGINTLAVSIEEQARERDTSFIALTWITGGLKLIPAFVALVRPRQTRIPHRLLLFAGWGIGVGFTLYGAAGTVEKALMMAGVIRIPDSFTETIVRWYLVFWDPWWTLGGVLFILAAWRYQRTAER